MTNALTDARAELLTLLGDELDDVQVVDYLPELVRPPVVLVTAGTPSLERGPTFGSVLARYDLTVVTETQTNERATDALDAQVVQTWTAMDDADGWSFETAGQPFMLQANNAQYLAVRLTYITQLYLTKE